MPASDGSPRLRVEGRITHKTVAALVDACDESGVPPLLELSQVVFAPAERLQEIVVNLLLVQLVGQLFEHEIGLLAGVFEIGGVGRGRIEIFA